MCILGSHDKQTTPIIAVLLFAVAVCITLLLTFIVYEQQEAWQTLGYMTSAFSGLTLVLMFVVMCSDPGIQSRETLLKIPS
jgi:amino acid transporter